MIFTEGNEEIYLDAAGFVGIDTISPGARLHVHTPATAGGAPLEVLRLEVEDEGVDLAIGMGPKLSFFMPHDVASFEGAYIAAEKENATDTNERTALTFATTPNAGAATEIARITGTGLFGIGTGAAVAAKLHVLDTGAQLRLTHTAGVDFCDFTADADGYMQADPSGERWGINVSPTAALHVDQPTVDAAIPVLTLDQGDVSEEMMELLCTIGAGNAIEAVGGKTLTTTHFIKVTIQGGLTRYFPVGTIA